VCVLRMLKLVNIFAVLFETEIVWVFDELSYATFVFIFLELRKVFLYFLSYFISLIQLSSLSAAIPAKLLFCSITFDAKLLDLTTCKFPVCSLRNGINVSCQ